MLHLGDITKISGYTAPIVDVVVGGSPCQDLSVAGKRAGLDGERSGLFMEQLRIIKEMRERDRRTGRTDEHIRPRFMVWENVPGAFSSNKSEDFRIVLEETAKVCGKDAVIPMPDKGKWTTSGCILGDGWSIAWRVLDAQFYGVPQRRRRIALVADFGGHSAPEILFIRKSMSRDTQPSQPQGKETPSDASRGTGADDIYCIDGDKLNKKERKGGSGIGYREGDKQYTLTAKDVHGVAYCFEPGAAKRLGGYVWEDLAPTLRTEVGDNRPSVAYANGNFIDVEMEVAVRKYPVDTKRLCEVLRQRKQLEYLSNKDIAEELDVPLTKVEHWFRQDECFAIPDPEIWMKLKEILDITTDEFDESITTFEYKGGNYDMRNRIHTSDTAPTLACGCGNNLYMLPQHNVAYTMQDREGKAGGGKGALIAEELSATLRAGFAQTLFQPIQCIDQGGGKSACNVQEGQAPTLTCTHGGEPAVCYSVENHPADSRVDIDESGKVQTLTSRMGTGGGNVPMVMTEVIGADLYNQTLTGDKAATVSSNSCITATRNGPTVVECYSKSKRAQTDTDYETWKESDVANTLNAFDVGDKRTTEAVVTLTGEEVCGTLMARDYKGVGRYDTFDRVICTAVDCRNGLENDVNGALQSNMAHSLNGNNVVRVKYIVRRLTPLECERLQGYPDGWTDIGEWTDSKGKVHKTSDAARYKALGNSIALPPWKWVLKRLCACYERDATLASLFDGIGGFPKIWEDLNGKGTCLWASEIEEFPIAVTKKRIGG